jgi:hypothetical protein
MSSGKNVVGPGRGDFFAVERRTGATPFESTGMQAPVIAFREFSLGARCERSTGHECR